MSNTQYPLISVVMAVKNGGSLVAGAIDSIMNQTYANLELIIINDGSTDNTLEILGQFDDPRIQVVSQENQGLAKSLNRGISLAKGRYIARQDHDDLSLPMRLEKQLAYMESHPRCGLLGTGSQIWTMEGPTGRFHDHPCDSGVLAFELLFNNPFVHTSWMFRREVIDLVGLYTNDPQREPPEDYEYASRIARHFDVANLPDRLVVYREMQNSMSSLIRPKNLVLNNPFSERLALISSENIAYVTKQVLPNLDAKNFGALTHCYPNGFSSLGHYVGVRDLLVLAAQNLQEQYPKSAINPLLGNRLNHLYYQYAYQEYLLAQKKSMLSRLWAYCQYRIKVAYKVRASQFLS